MKNYVLYIGNFRIEQLNAAGKRVLNNARLFRDLGYSVILLGVDDGNTTSMISRPRLVEEKIYYSKYPERLLKQERANIYLFNLSNDLFMNRINNLSLIITYGAAGLSITNLHLIMYAKKRKIKILSDIVDWLKPDSGNYLFRIIKSFDINLRMRIINKRYDGLIVVSRSLKRYYKQYGNRITVIPPLVDSTKSDFKIPNSSIQIVYAGIPFSLNRQSINVNLMKDRIDIVIILLAELTKTFTDFEFHIYGFTKEQLLFALPGMQCYINILGERIVFHGLVPTQTIDDKLNEADYTILIRDCNRLTNMGFPTKIVESISHGVPVITTRNSDVEDYLNDDHCVHYIDLNNSLSYTVSSIRDIFNISPIVRLQNKQRISIHNPFSLQNYYNRTKKLLNNIK